MKRPKRQVPTLLRPALLQRTHRAHTLPAPRTAHAGRRARRRRPRPARHGAAPPMRRAGRGRAQAGAERRARRVVVLQRADVVFGGVVDAVLEAGLDGGRAVQVEFQGRGREVRQAGGDVRPLVLVQEAGLADVDPLFDAEGGVVGLDPAAVGVEALEADGEAVLGGAVRTAEDVALNGQLIVGVFAAVVRVDAQWVVRRVVVLH